MLALRKRSLTCFGRRWRSLIGYYYTDFSRAERAVNELAVIIRLVEALNRVLQRRCYGEMLDWKTRGTDDTNLPSSLSMRLRLPGALNTPAVPALLPFHCVRAFLLGTPISFFTVSLRS